MEDSSLETILIWPRAGIAYFDITNAFLFVMFLVNIFAACVLDMHKKLENSVILVTHYRASVFFFSLYERVCSRCADRYRESEFPINFPTIPPLSSKVMVV